MPAIQIKKGNQLRFNNVSSHGDAHPALSSKSSHVQSSTRGTTNIPSGNKKEPNFRRVRNEGTRRTPCGSEEGYTIERVGKVAAEDPLEEENLQ
jgi:hypothetical protein